MGMGGPDGGFDATLSDTEAPPVDSGKGGTDSGAGDTSAPTDSGRPPIDSGVEDSGPVDSSPPLDSSLPDAPDDAADACLPAEICNNGIDDNCDGKIDCDDPMCGAWTCTAAAVPSGWSVVEYNQGQRPSCDPGYGSAKVAYEGPSGAPASCSCACSVTTPGSCIGGNFGNDYSFGVGGCGTPMPLAANGGACTTGPKFANTGVDLAVSPAPYDAGICLPSQTASTKPVAFQNVGESCRELDAGGAGCNSGGSCVPKTTSGFSLCILHDGTETCPTGFSDLHTVGTDAGDTRGCSPCTCGAPTATCGNASVTFYQDTNCSQGAQTVPANGMCAAFPGPMGNGLTGPFYVTYEYTAQVENEGCGAATPGVPEGGVELTGIRTICCQ